MRRVTYVVGFALAAASIAACGGYGSSEATSTTTVTAARTQGDDRPFDERIAIALCSHEQACGRASSESCLGGARQRVSTELGAWDCAPAESRASIEQCVASLRDESCSVDLSTRRNVCPLTAACRSASTSSDDTSRRVSPGPALADIWRR